MRTVAEFAARVVGSTDLDEKLAPPPRDLLDEDRGSGDAPRRPGRPEDLRIVPGREANVPPLAGWNDLDQRRRILHSLANHELQATELFAWALLAFPDAPDGFRAGLLEILREEQVHTRLYRHRLAALGGRFGEHPVSGLFWNRLADIQTPAEFVAALSLTFENANLDHAPEAAAVARAHGDEETARVLDRVARDEVRHVAFGATWLPRLAAGGGDLWSLYRDHLRWPLHPGRARGTKFREEPRREAGLDNAFIRGLAAATRKVADGADSGGSAPGGASTRGTDEGGS